MQVDRMEMGRMELQGMALLEVTVVQVIMVPAAPEAQVEITPMAEPEHPIPLAEEEGEVEIMVTQEATVEAQELEVAVEKITVVPVHLAR